METCRVNAGVRRSKPVQGHRNPDPSPASSVRDRWDTKLSISSAYPFTVPSNPIASTGQSRDAHRACYTIFIGRGRRLKLVKLPEQKGVAGAVHEEVVPPEEEATTTIHERLMRVNTNDYGSFVCRHEEVELIAPQRRSGLTLGSTCLLHHLLLLVLSLVCLLIGDSAVGGGVSSAYQIDFAASNPVLLVEGISLTATYSSLAVITDLLDS
ncbi:hypothetical protein SAY87_019794 [Trapa incisa]|uniref:Uncharacterized protein n=1 Tax=Trapa incisa TaxID=236973 RepID=A0AAN7Q375_9MYRT|nr:hypothetical protein SAY87_019794 [Trapa incisa]